MQASVVQCIKENFNNKVQSTLNYNKTAIFDLVKKICDMFLAVFTLKSVQYNYFRTLIFDSYNRRVLYYYITKIKYYKNPEKHIAKPLFKKFIIKRLETQMSIIFCKTEFY